MRKPNLVAQEESNMLVVVLVKITVLSIDDVSSKNGLNSGKLAAAPRPKKGGMRA
jgi:hypothetical protein